MPLAAGAAPCSAAGAVALARASACHAATSRPRSRNRCCSKPREASCLRWLVLLHRLIIEGLVGWQGDFKGPQQIHKVVVAEHAGHEVALDDVEERRSMRVVAFHHSHELQVLQQICHAGQNGGTTVGDGAEQSHDGLQARQGRVHDPHCVQTKDLLGKLAKENLVAGINPSEDGPVAVKNRRQLLPNGETGFTRRSSGKIGVRHNGREEALHSGCDGIQVVPELERNHQVLLVNDGTPILACVSETRLLKEVEGESQANVLSFGFPMEFGLLLINKMSLLLLRDMQIKTLVEAGLRVGTQLIEAKGVSLDGDEELLPSPDRVVRGVARPEESRRVVGQMRVCIQLIVRRTNFRGCI